jgi:hypothetical protein
MSFELNLNRLAAKRSKMEAFPADTLSSEGVHSVVLEVGLYMSNTVLPS